MYHMIPPATIMFSWSFTSSVFCVCNVILVFNISILRVSAEDKDAYLAKRRALLQEEWNMTTGGDVVLNEDERKANIVLMKWKAAELNDAMQPSGFFPPAHNFMTAKSTIEESDVYKFIKRMPKGAVLHIHDTAMASYMWLIQNVTYRQDCYMCFDNTGHLSFRLASSKPTDTRCRWDTVNHFRRLLGNASMFDEYLYKNMSIMTDNPTEAYQTVYSVWQRFGSAFAAVGGLVFNTETFGPYFEQALKELHADNVQYVETRALLGPVYDLNGIKQSHDWAVSKYKEVQQRFSEEHPDFFGAKTIYTVPRMNNLMTITSDVKEAIRLRKKFPDSVLGFDLVGMEDQGHSLQYFLDALLYPSQHGIKLPYFFHAGETDWEGTAVDENMLDALLLNTSRIGHGYAVTKHPHIRKLLRDKNVAIELNPISNQVLLLVSDLRNHPAAALIAEGYPVVISSDDPAMWGSTGVSHDFYEAFMGLGGAWANLATLKKFAMDSIRHSALKEVDKTALYRIWQAKWDAFIQEILQEYDL